MYNNFDFNHSGHTPRAYEIELRVRDLEKKYALMNALNRYYASADPLAGLKKTSRRIASLIGSIFLG